MTALFLGNRAFNNVAPRSLLNLERDREYHACGCLHVRTGTLLLGLTQIIVHLLVMMTTVVLIMNPASWQPSSSQYHVMELALHMFPFSTSHSPPSSNLLTHSMKGRQFVVNDQSFLPSHGELKGNETAATTANPVGILRPLRLTTKTDVFQDIFAFDSPKSRVSSFEQAQLNKRGERLWSLLLTVISLFFTMALVHGCLFRKARHLLPYFCVQVCDFVLACLTVMGYMTYIPEWKSQRADPAIQVSRPEESFTMPSTEEDNDSFQPHLSPVPSGPVYWHHLDSSTRLAFMSLAFLLLAFKFYLMGMVWSCYKYFILWNRLNSTIGSGESPATLRAAFQDVWSHLRQPVGRSGPVWIPLGSRLLGMGSSQRASNVGQDPLSGLNEEELIGSGHPADMNSFEEHPPLEPPKYEDVLKQPANSNMPPPYFKEGNKSSTENLGPSGSQANQ